MVRDFTLHREWGIAHFFLAYLGWHRISWNIDIAISKFITKGLSLPLTGKKMRHRRPPFLLIWMKASSSLVLWNVLEHFTLLSIDVNPLFVQERSQPCGKNLLAQAAKNFKMPFPVCQWLMRFMLVGGKTGIKSRDIYANFILLYI